MTPHASRRVAIGLDWLALLLCVVALSIWIAEGWVIRLPGLRITASSPVRGFAAALVAVVVRLVLDRRTSPFGAGRAFLRRVYDPSSDTTTPQPVGSTWRRHLPAIAGLIGFGVLMLQSQLTRIYWVPDLGDPLFSMWRVGWVYQQVLGDPRPLFDTNIFHPLPLTLAYSDSMLLPALTEVPLLALGLHPVVAYNIILTSSFLFSALAMYLLVERLTGSRRAGFVSGVLFGFYPYRFEHYSHLELQMTYWMPLALLALHRFLATRRTRDIVIAALLAVAQWYSSMYYGVFFGFFLTAVFVIGIACGRIRLRTVARPVAAAAVLAVVLAYPLARPYLRANLGDRDPGTVEFYSALTSDYLRSNIRSAAWGERMLPGRLPERALFPGVMPLVLAAAALVPPLGATRTMYAGGMVVAFELSRGFNSHVYPYLYDWLPPLRGLRVPARASILVGLSLAVLGGIGARRLLTRAPPAASRLLFGLLLALTAWDMRPILKLEPVWREPPAVYAALKDTPGVVLAEFPLGGIHYRFTADMPYLYFSLWHWAQMVNGYSGHNPDSYLELEKETRSFPEPAALASLRARGVTHVTVNCALYRGGCDEFLVTIDATPGLRPIASVRWEGQPVRLYELIR